MEHYAYQYFFNLFGWLLIEEAFFALPISRKKFFPLRLLGMLALCYPLGYGLVLLVRHIPNELAWMTIFYYTAVFLLSMLVLRACLQVEWKEILFVSTAGYAVQHITYAGRDIAISLYNAVSESPYDTSSAGNLVFNWIPYILMGALSYFLLVKPTKDRAELKQVDIRMILISLAILASSVVLSELVPAAGGGGFTEAHVVCRVYAILACVLGLFMQFSVSWMNRMETERTVLEQLLHMEQQQHNMTKETIDIINMKCHDLKYQIAALEHMDSSAQRVSIEELKRSVDVYDSTVKSGNDTLDLVLTEKSLICQKYHIKFSCILDGAQLYFMKSSDIYSLFGNALDNAIESVLQAEEPKRIITLRVVSIGQMLMIHMDNYCAVPLEFKDGLPVTTKGDARFHGFGTRSIRYIAGLYSGDTRMSWESEQFSLDILLPIPEADGTRTATDGPR